MFQKKHLAREMLPVPDANARAVQLCNHSVKMAEDAIIINIIKEGEREREREREIVVIIVQMQKMNEADFHRRPRPSVRFWQPHWFLELFWFSPRRLTRRGPSHISTSQSRNTF